MDRLPVPEAVPKLSQLAYRRFKEALFSGRVRAGTTVSQADLVGLTGVPISPLREAIQVLEAEGLVSVRPRAGIRIAKPDLALVRNAYQLRGMLELPAMRHAAEALPRDRLLALERSHEALIAETAGIEVTRDIAERVRDEDFGFHREIVGFMANPLLDRAYRQAHDHIQLIRLDQLYMLSSAAIARTMQEHLVIIRACLARDPAAAGAALEHHFAKAMQRALGM